MGRDIYAHIEYKHTSYLYFGEVMLERSNILFALLGGYPGPVESLFPLRGVPDDMNLNTGVAWYMSVREGETDRERCLPRWEAERWVEEGAAQWCGPNHITDPDFFSPSWLLSHELEQVYQQHLARAGLRLPTYDAALAAMHLLPAARLVYWFGN